MPLAKTSMSCVLGICMLFGLALFTSCSGRVGSHPTLVNQGILPLSTSNAYVGSNLFLSYELERSTYLYNFFRGRGAPTAIELIESGLSTPRLLMYYPREKEVYASDLQIRHATGEREWIIRGPYSIERSDYRQLANLETSLVGEPVFILWGKEHRFRFQFRPEAPSVKLPPVEHEPAPPKPTPKPKKKTPVITATASAAASPAPTPQREGPLSSDQQALQRAKDLAKRLPNGDLVHIATANTSFEALVTWYTGSGDNIAEVAKANSIADPKAPLAAGKEIKIPATLVKQPLQFRP